MPTSDCGVRMPTIVAAMLLALCTTAHAISQLDSLMGVLESEFVPFAELTKLVIRLDMPARTPADMYIEGTIVIENTGEVQFLLPLDLQPGHGFVRFDWTRADGGANSVGQLGANSTFKLVELRPGSFYGQRFSLGIAIPPCYRISGPETCNWEPGRYVFTATIQVPPDPTPPPAGVASPRLVSGSWSTEPVAVEIVR